MRVATYASGVLSPVFKKLACVCEVTASCVKEQGPCWFKCSTLIAKALIFNKTCCVSV